jgi:hypothetical protein
MTKLSLPTLLYNKTDNYFVTIYIYKILQSIVPLIRIFVNEILIADFLLVRDAWQVFVYFTNILLNTILGAIYTNNTKGTSSRVGIFGFFSGSCNIFTNMRNA